MVGNCISVTPSTATVNNAAQSAAKGHNESLTGGSSTAYIARGLGYAMAANREWPRKSFNEAMELVPLQMPAVSHTSSDTATGSSSRDGIKRYMSTQPAWTPGNDLPWEELSKTNKDARRHHAGPGAFGGCVYAMASLAAARAVEEEERRSGGDIKNRPGIHVRF